MLTQKKFNEFVENYNADYLYLLRRASTGNYNCLITSSRILQDLYDMVTTLQRVTELEFEVVPYPFTLRGNQEYFEQLGFTPEQAANIDGFLRFVREIFGKEFEECMQEARPLTCSAS